MTIDEGLPVDVIYLDFAKAFDKVQYKRPAKKFDICFQRKLPLDITSDDLMRFLYLHGGP